MRIRMKFRFEDFSSFSKFWSCFLQSFQSHHRSPQISDLRHSHTSLRCESGGAKHSSYETTQAATETSSRILEVIFLKRKFDFVASQPKSLPQPHPSLSPNESLKTSSSHSHSHVSASDQIWDRAWVQTQKSIFLIWWAKIFDFRPLRPSMTMIRWCWTSWKQRFFWEDKWNFKIFKNLKINLRKITLLSG